MQYHENYNLTHAPVRTIPRIKNGSAAETQLALKKMKLNYSDQAQGAQWVKVSESDDRIALQQRSIQANKVPNVKGMPLNDAVYLLENGGLRVKVFGNGQVVKQSLEPGSELVKGTSITLELK